MRPASKRFKLDWLFGQHTVVPHSRGIWRSCVMLGSNRRGGRTPSFSFEASSFHAIQKLCNRYSKFPPCRLHHPIPHWRTKLKDFKMMIMSSSPPRLLWWWGGSWWLGIEMMQFGSLMMCYLSSLKSTIKSKLSTPPPRFQESYQDHSHQDYK